LRLRARGIANFLALARIVAAEQLSGDFVFVATAGHEIGHGGMELFLEQGAPSPQDTLAWVHLGASNACFAWTAGPEGFSTERKVDDALRFLVLSPSAAPLVNETFAAISATRQVAEKQPNCAMCRRPVMPIFSAWLVCIASSMRRPTICEPQVRRSWNRWPGPSPMRSEKPWNVEGHKEKW
jgi:hypothetical protein